MPSLSDVVIVGGGIIGSAIAYNLVRAGAKVTVLERDGVASGASGVGAGMLSVIEGTRHDKSMFALGRASLRLVKDTTAALREETGLDPEYVQVGMVRVAFNDREEQALRALQETAKAEGMEVDWLKQEDLLPTEPGLSSDIIGALYSLGEHQIRANRLTEAFARAAANRGADYRLGAFTAGLMCQGQRVTGVHLADGSHLSADHVVIAAGPWSGQLTADLGVSIPVRPVRGQLVHLHSVARVIRMSVVYGGSYITPKVDGTLIVGATQEEAGFDRRSTAEGVASLLNLAPQLVPALATAEVTAVKVGLRPGTPDDLPILGPVPGWDGLSVATGHFRSGVVLSPITGKLVAEAIISGAIDPLLRPFSLGRFL